MTSILNEALISPGIWSSERSTAGDASGLSDRHERDLRTAAPRTGAAGVALIWAKAGWPALPERADTGRDPTGR